MSSHVHHPVVPVALALVLLAAPFVSRPAGAAGPAGKSGATDRSASPGTGGDRGGRGLAAPVPPAREGKDRTAERAGGGDKDAASGGETPINGCRPLPAHRRVVKLNLKPDTDIADLVAWISSVTCRQFVLPGIIPAASKHITVVAPQLISREEAYRLFLAALDSVGLTVQPSGAFYRIIETSKAKNSPMPLYGADGELLYGGG